MAIRPNLTAEQWQKRLAKEERKPRRSTVALAGPRAKVVDYHKPSGFDPARSYLQHIADMCELETPAQVALAFDETVQTVMTMYGLNKREFAAYTGYETGAKILIHVDLRIARLMGLRNELHGAYEAEERRVIAERNRIRSK